jgi:hypothetical protein
VNTRHGHAADSGAAASPSVRSRGSIPACSSEDLPAPETPDTTSRPAPSSRCDIRSSIAVAAASRPKKNAASRSSYAFNPRYGESTAPDAVTSAGGAAPSLQVSLSAASTVSNSSAQVAKRSSRRFASPRSIAWSTADGSAGLSPLRLGGGSDKCA